MAKRSVKQQLRARLGPRLQSVGFSTGLMQLAARLRGLRGAIVLMYHSVARPAEAHWIDPHNHVPADVFEQQMAFLAQRRTVISLSQLVDRVRTKRSIEPNTVVLTFDDGYRDNLTVAAPILDRHGLKATLFLPTGYIDRSESQWIDRIYATFTNRSRNALTWGSESKRSFDLAIPSQSAEAYRLVAGDLLVASFSKRRDMLDELVDQLQPTRYVPRLTMNWDDVRTLVNDHTCFEIGGHTVDHIDLTSCDTVMAKNEVEICAKRIEEQLGARPRHFAFPYNRSSAALRQLVQAAGFESACESGIDPLVTSATDPFAFPRVEAHASMERFDLLTSEANTGLWRKLGRSVNGTYGPNGTHG